MRTTSLAHSPSKSNTTGMTELATSSQHAIRPRPIKRTKVTDLTLAVISEKNKTASSLNALASVGRLGVNPGTSTPVTQTRLFSVDSAKSPSARRISQALKAQRCPTNKEISPFCKFLITFKHY